MESVTRLAVGPAQEVMAADRAMAGCQDRDARALSSAMPPPPACHPSWLPHPHPQKRSSHHWEGAATTPSRPTYDGQGRDTC